MRGIGAVAGLRAMLRLARRDAWRNRGRSALIAVMVALPVLCLSAASVIYRSDQRDPQDWVALRLGPAASAQALITGNGKFAQVQNLDGATSSDLSPIPGSGVTTSFAQAGVRLAVALPSADHLLLDRTAFSDGGIRHSDRALAVDVREFDYTGTGARGLFRQVSGRAPQAIGEVDVTQALAKAEGVAVGDRLADSVAGAPAAQLTVVGVVGGIPLIGREQVIGRPGMVLPALAAGVDALHDRPKWMVVGPAAVTWKQVLNLNAAGFVVTSRAVVADPPPSDQIRDTEMTDEMGPLGQRTASLVGVITVAIGLVLLQIALLAGPAIAVGARRNERTLALVAASGGGRRQLRSIVLATSGVIGLVGCTLAALVGAVIGMIAVPLLRSHRDQQLIRTDVHALDLVVLIAVGALTAIAAALIPARQAARMDVVAVLTGRRDRAPMPARVPLLGLLIAAIGCATCLFGANGRHQFITVAGIAIAEIGLVTITGAIIALCARAAPRLPFAGRFALRDASRQRGRTAPAIAAVMAAVAGSVAAGIFLTSQSHHSQAGHEPLAVVGDTTLQFTGPAALAGAITPSMQTAAISALRRTLPIKDVGSYRSTVHRDGHRQTDDVELTPSRDAAVSNSVGPEAGLYLSGRGHGLLFDDGSTLQLLTGAPDPQARAALRAGKVVLYDPYLFWPDGSVHAQISSELPNGQAKFKRTVVLPAELITSRPGVAGPVFPLSAAKTLGLPISVQGLVASTTRTPTDREAQRAAAAVNAVAPASVHVERGFQDHHAIGLLALVLAALIITLGGTFAAVGLAAAEGRADVSTLSAIGAGPGVRRRLAGAQAAVIAVIGSGLGLLTGLLAGWALVQMENLPDAAFPPGQRSALQYLNSPFVVPWGMVTILVIGVPVLAVAISYLSTRSRLPLLRRLGQ